MFENVSGLGSNSFGGYTRPLGMSSTSVGNLRCRRQLAQLHRMAPHPPLCQCRYGKTCGKLSDLLTWERCRSLYVSGKCSLRSFKNVLTCFRILSSKLILVFLIFTCSLKCDVLRSYLPFLLSFYSFTHRFPLQDIFLLCFCFFLLEIFLFGTACHKVILLCRQLKRFLF